MKKIAMVILASMTMTMGYASDTLDGSKWKTLDDNNGQTRFLIEIKKAKNNSYEGVITEVMISEINKFVPHVKVV